MSAPLTPLPRWGSSPQARGAGRPRGLEAPHRGFIPAGAGSRADADRFAPLIRVHPRRRGEQPPRRIWLAQSKGSSPQARGAGENDGGDPKVSRFTPAGAGSRRRGPGPRVPSRVHPRRRGEQSSHSATSGSASGSPPQARGAGGPCPVAGGRRGFTPAGAGSRPDTVTHSCPSWVHPRRRGEECSSARSTTWTGGSPPQARGADELVALLAGAFGFTPAGAGSRSPTRLRRS